MNKNTLNTILGILIIFGILVGYSLWTKPSDEEMARRKKVQDSLIVAHQQKLKNDSLEQIRLAAEKLKTDSVAAQKTDSLKASGVSDSVITTTTSNDRFGVFSLSSKGNKRYYILENDLLKLKISAQGGGISSVELKEYKTYYGEPLLLFDTDTSSFGLSFFASNRDINTSALFFEAFTTGAAASADSLTVSGNNSLDFSMRLYPNADDSTLNKNSYIEYSYHLSGNDYRIGFKVKLVNMEEVIAGNNTYLGLDWKVDLRQQEKSLQNEEMVTTVYFRPADDKVDNLKENKSDEKDFKAPVKWVSFKQQFFSSTLIADSKFDGAKMKSEAYSDSMKSSRIKTLSADLTLPYSVNANLEYPMSFYFGPNHYRTLRAYKLDLERQIPLGWGFFLLQWINRFAVIPVFNLLDGMGINYGIIILILTILLKIVLLPIAYKTYMSSAKMRVLKPEVDELAKKFPKKEDALKKQQAQMALYKKAGVNPMSGCIPLLLQMPILIALYRFFPASIELRQQPFLWAEDLSTYDSILSLGFNIPFYGDHVSLFTLLMTVTTIIYTRINNQMMGGQTQPGMKLMLYLMPVMFLGFFNNFAAGLSYYYFLANVLTFFQMYLFRRFVNEDKIHAQIQENKKKPVKKSGFQSRLEEMAKKRGYNPPRK